MLIRCVAALVALLCAALAVFLALLHPLSAVATLAGVSGLAALTFARPVLWPMLLLFLLPLVGLMPWSGWVLVEELDLAVLAVAAGAYLRWAITNPHANMYAWPKPSSAPGAEHSTNTSSLAWLWLLPLALSTVISLFRGVDDAGGFGFSLWHGYREPMNSLRLAKPMLATALLLPVWLVALRLNPKGLHQAFWGGLLGLLGGTALGVWWERLAFTGLLNFSSDYRATGAFWEMHVGGAALDALVVAGLPFCTAALVRERRPLHFGALLVLLGLAAYAALMTFSRIVYLAAPLAVLVAWALQQRQQPPQAEQPGGANMGRTWQAPVLGAAWVALTVPVALTLFPVAGYRGLLAWLGAACCLLALGPHLRRIPARVLALGLSAGLLGVGAVTGLSWAAPKLSYLAYGIACVATLGFTALATLGSKPAPGLFAAALAGLLATLTGVVAVSAHWGGEAAWAASLGATAALLAVLALLAVGAAAATPAWPPRWSWQALVATCMVAVSAVVAVFSGGAYMGGRMTATASDSATRTEHWSRSLSWLNTTDWVLGKGLGRYVSNHALSGRTEDQVGDMRWLASPDAKAPHAVVLTSGKHMMGFGAMYRLSQRVAMPSAGTARLVLQSRHDKAVDVVVEICEKHLLYQSTCMVGRRTLPATNGAWQAQTFELVGKVPLTAGLFFAPRMAVFSLGLPQTGQRIELSGLRLEDAQGNKLLANGRFEQGLARWFTSSDHHHMPWHAKNLGVHLLFEQGYLGLLGFCVASGVALWRVSWGAARGHAVAPALAGALLGVLVVGAVDSLLDMPRVGFVMWMLLAAALSIPGRGLRPAASHRQQQNQQVRRQGSAGR